VTGRRSTSEPPGFDHESGQTTLKRQQTITHDQKNYDCLVIESIDSLYAIGYGYNPTSDSSRIFFLNGDDQMVSLPSTRPTDADISNSGTAIVIESGVDADLTSTIKILNKNGETRIQHDVGATIGTCGISSDGAYAVAVSRTQPSQVHIYDVASSETMTTELCMSGLAFNSFQQSRDGIRICLGDGSRPHLTLDTSGDTVWESDTYRSMRPKLDQVRDWLSG